MRKVMVFEQANCPQCRMTLSWLDAHSVSYRCFSLDKHPEYREKLRAQGFLMTPVVFVGDQGWSGFRPTQLSLMLGGVLHA